MSLVCPTLAEQLTALGAVAYISESSLRNAMSASKAAELEVTRAFEALDETGRYCLSAWIETAANTWNRLASIHAKPLPERVRQEQSPTRREKQRIDSAAKLDELLELL